MTKKTKEAILTTAGFIFLIGIPAVWGNWDAIQRKYNETFHPAETAAKDAKMEADFKAATGVIERHLLTDVDQAGNAFVGYDGHQRFLISVEDSCGVFTLAEVKDSERGFGPMDDLEKQASKPIYVVKYGDSSWGFEQGDESCSATVTTR
ncbi:MAG: hypothetical protein WA175_11365 [Candidatus Acidiferrales bacterium]